jgi:uncharacterized membrane protein
MAHPISEAEAAAARPAPPVPRVRFVPLGAPLRWLASGARDVKAHPRIALFYGACFWAMAAVLGVVFRFRPEWTMTLVSGCLLLGPFLVMGLYEVSRQREQGGQPDLAASLTCWKRHVGSMSLLVLVLVLLELVWGRASLVAFALFFDNGLPTTLTVFDAVFNPRNWQFVAVYLAVGAVFAAAVFCFMVVTIPIILDRDTDAVTASLTSLFVVLNNLGAMLFWGALVVVLTLVALWPWALGIVVVGPWLGYATWHAYRDAVGWDR